MPISTHNPNDAVSSARRHTPRGRDRKVFYASRRWRKLRSFVLARSPLCVDPFGRHRAAGCVVVAEIVDHVIPRHVRPDLTWRLENLQALCWSCHSVKTGREQRGLAMPTESEDFPAKSEGGSETAEGVGDEILRWPVEE